jgi:hypothetical protein
VEAGVQNPLGVHVDVRDGRAVGLVSGNAPCVVPDFRPVGESACMIVNPKRPRGGHETLRHHQVPSGKRGIQKDSGAGFGVGVTVLSIPADKWCEVCDRLSLPWLPCVDRAPHGVAMSRTTDTPRPNSAVGAGGIVLCVVCLLEARATPSAFTTGDCRLAKPLST